MALEQKKSELSITKPDSTFARYSYDQFKKSRSAKSVPHESLDFTIYKSSSNCVAFLTSEERLIKWIQAIYERYHVRLQDATTTSKMKAVWEELQNVSDTSKTDKISIHLSLQNDDIVENIVTIIIYCTTGRIQIQGKSLHEWGDVEFNVLRNMVDGKPESKDLDEFIEAITQKTSGETKNTNEDCKIAKSEIKPENEKISDIAPNNPEHSTESPTRGKSFNEVKHSVATLESEFVLFKQETLKIFENIKITMKEKDDEITELKQRVASLEATNELLQNEGNDYKLLIKKQNTLEKKVKLLTHDNKQKSPTTPIPPTEEQPLTTHYTIPISNMFNPLDNDCEENGKPTTKKTVTAETIILCDSNGKHLDPKLLCPGSPTQYIRCPTVNGATKILDEYEFTSPQTFVIHSGTNDIESTNCKEVCNKLTTLTTYITTKYPDCRILLSSLLPRSDHLLQRVQLLNSEIEKIQSPNIIHVKHHNLFRSTNILYDKKHLNRKGVKLFAKNLKGAFVARKNNKTKQQHSHSNLYNYHYPGRDHHHLMPRNYPPPSFQPPTFHQPRPPTFHRPQPPTFHLPQPHQPTLSHPNKSWHRTKSVAIIMVKGGVKRCYWRLYSHLISLIKFSKCT
ncbi:Hypothetical predicted protein [Paramuricea clavata]|uniref:Uncharacterized protein n=1 Tax=Paramuricea clavata TaxID=317549 RepID=A0A7D9EJF7_PARCT|nr:Hypothetical predicted protein [Paramuricea clavata]